MNLNNFSECFMCKFLKSFRKSALLYDEITKVLLCRSDMMKEGGMKMSGTLKKYIFK